jgi:predicted nucleic-acid-binding Zn-ribbon protein
MTNHKEVYLMKDGICPKCGSEEVFKTRGSNNLQTTRMQFAAFPMNYICADCGYCEWYVDNVASLEDIRSQWESANPKRKRKNDEA